VLYTLLNPGAYKVEHSTPKTEFKASGEPRARLTRWWVVAINLWISAVILRFFLLRVIDSDTAHRIFHFLGHFLGHSLAHSLGHSLAAR
jgi:hypothetical protein